VESTLILHQDLIQETRRWEKLQPCLLNSYQGLTAHKINNYSENIIVKHIFRWSTGPLPIVEYEETPRPTRDSPTSIIPKYANKAIQAPPILKPSRTNSTLPHSRPNKSISVISSGSGLWRKQLEHILTHHENHANKDTVYRQKVADLRMGSVVESEIGLSADPETDQQYMSIVLSFASPDNPDYPSSKSSSAWELYKTSPVKKTQENPNQEKKKKKAKKAAPKTTAEKILEALSHEERLLLAEVGSRGQHRLGQVALLLDSGKFEKLSNINCQNEKGVTPLYLGKISFFRGTHYQNI